MTKDDLMDDDSSYSTWKYLGHIVGWSLLLSLALGALGAMTAAINHLRDGGGLADYIILGVGSLVIVTCAYLMWGYRPDFTLGEPKTKCGNQVRLMLVATAAFGAVLAALIVSADNGDDWSPLFSNGPISPTIALITGGAWALLIPPLIIFARRIADEHKLAGQDFGMMVGFQVFAIVTPAWWMGWRGGFLPQPDAMLIFAATLVIASIIAIWKQAV